MPLGSKLGTALRRHGRRVLAVAIAALSLVPLSIATYDTALADSESLDGVIVLGAAIYRNKPSPVFAARLDWARDLWRASRVETVIVTGGVGEGEALSEAEVGRSYLAAQGVHPDAILIEKLSRTTFENLCNAALFAERGELKKVAIVSDPLHLRRALVLARDAGLDAVPAGTPYTRYRGIWTRLKFTLRESYFLGRRLIAGSERCKPADVFEPPLTPLELTALDAEPTRRKLERLVAIPGVFRSERDQERVVRAYAGLRSLAEKGFADFASCANDPRPVWDEFTKQIAGPTTLGHICVDLITEHVDALYLKKEGLNVVTATNAGEWWAQQNGRTLPEMQIDALATYRDRIAEQARGEQGNTYLVDVVLPELNRRLDRARSELATNRPLTIETSPAP